MSPLFFACKESWAAALFDYGKYEALREIGIISCDRGCSGKGAAVPALQPPLVD